LKNDMQCPYCGADQEVNHDDGQGYAEDELHQHECSECEQYFVFTTAISFHYSPHEAECLNTGEHKYKATKTIPHRYTKMRCVDCGDEKPCVRVRLLKSQDDEALPVGTEGNVIEGTMEHSGMLRVLFDNGLNIPMYRNELESI